MSCEEGFFTGHPNALSIYTVLRERIMAFDEGLSVRLGRSQLSFYGRHMFAAVSFLPCRKAAKRPKDYLTLTIGLSYRLPSPRVDIATEPWPGRWTHHIMLTDSSEVDDELLAWLYEAYEFSEAKR